MNKLTFLILLSALIILPCKAEIVQDEFVNETLKNLPIEKPKAHLNYNYQSTKRIPIKMHLTEDIKSENKIYEGQTVYFKVVQDVINDGIVEIPSGTIASARIETIITSGMNGIPASIIFGDFNFPNIDPNKIDYTYEKFGQDRSLLVFPLKWALTILPPTGSLTNFIKGGHARLKANKIIEINYYPDWQ